MNKIRKGDEVIVLTGRDKGKRGTVQAMLGDKVVVEGVNVAKKHTQPEPDARAPPVAWSTRSCRLTYFQRGARAMPQRQGRSRVGHQELKMCEARALREVDLAPSWPLDSGRR